MLLFYSDAFLKALAISHETERFDFSKKTVSETHGKDYDRQYGVQASEGIACHWLEKGLQNSDREADGFIQLLTQDQTEGKLHGAE